MNNNEQPLPMSGWLAPGTEVEVVSRLVASGAARLRASAKDQGRRGIMERYEIDARQLDRIEAEGMDEKWPRWDGLADELGPIPAFGPARTDEHGRVVMSDEEWTARRDSVVRALRATGDITDETDTDEVWDEVFRGLKETR